MMTDLNFWMTYSFKPTYCTHKELHPESTLGFLIMKHIKLRRADRT